MLEILKMQSTWTLVDSVPGHLKEANTGTPKLTS